MAKQFLHDLRTFGGIQLVIQQPGRSIRNGNTKAIHLLPCRVLIDANAVRHIASVGAEGHIPFTGQSGGGA
ncbi:hypothetical protein D3C77_404630 [compost metagenome]